MIGSTEVEHVQSVFHIFIVGSGAAGTRVTRTSRHRKKNTEKSRRRCQDFYLAGLDQTKIE